MLNLVQGFFTMYYVVIETLYREIALSLLLAHVELD